ncbi:MAG: preprotein translocase subunit YajC [Spirochaetes bacterium]|nr:preprotein translocase subunit YajC [Spirochaetota bacterium]
MNALIFPLLMGGGGQPPPADGAAGFFTSMIPFIAIIGIFYFLIIRPQSKKRKETEKMLGAIKKGDRIITIGGVHGTIQSVREQTVIVKVDENVKLEFNRGAIAQVTPVYDKDDRSDSKEVSS